MECLTFSFISLIQNVFCLVFLDGHKIKDIISWGQNYNYTISLSNLTHPIHNDKEYDGHLLDILVENLGRVNFGHEM